MTQAEGSHLMTEPLKCQLWHTCESINREKATFNVFVNSADTDMCMETKLHAKPEQTRTLICTLTVVT